MPRPFSITLIAVLALASCKRDKEDPVAPAPPANEEELITTLRLHFHSANDVEHLHFDFIDVDGTGGNAPLITADTLSADSTYAVTIEVLDESGSTPEDITAEISAEDEAHQFFFGPLGANAIVSYNDADGNGNPIGLSSIWSIGSASAGTVLVTLVHEPDKGAQGVSGGDITNAGGETDIEVEFPLVIE